MEMMQNKYKLTQFDVFQNAGQESGAYALFDGTGILVFVAWSHDLSQILLKHLPANERDPRLRDKTKLFGVFSCGEETDFPAFFDTLIEQTGVLPSVRDCIPEKSRWFGSEEPAEQQQVHALVAKAQKLFKADDAEGAVALLEKAPVEGNTFPDYHVLYGQIIAVQGFNKAIEQFEKAAELDPTSASGLKAAALAERCYDLLVGFKKV